MSLETRPQAGHIISHFVKMKLNIVPVLMLGLLGSGLAYPNNAVDNQEVGVATDKPTSLPAMTKEISTIPDLKDEYQI